MLQAFYSNMFSISFSVNSVLELFLTTNIVYNTLYKEGGLSMKPYLFRLEQECEHLAATEYIYEIGTFHYNWHKDLEILVILKLLKVWPFYSVWTPIFWKNIFPATSTYVLNCVQMPKVKICSLTA